MTIDEIDALTDEEVATLRCISLDGERLTVLRGAIDERIVMGGTERIRTRTLPPIHFQRGVYPPVGERMDKDVAKEEILDYAGEQGYTFPTYGA